MLKRAFDFICSTLGLLILFPLWITIVLILCIDDRGPILFIQKRVGLNHRPFLLYKFRSMAPENNLPSDNFEAGNLSRVTRIGKFLRKTKLDELPQLINVLKGDMSLVGPRPEVRKWVETYPDKWARVLTVKPGITDNASVLFRNEEEVLSMETNPENYYKEIILPEKLNLYIKYVNNHPFAGDVAIILRTIFSIFKK
jgi:lipopolysaccharide/colanic/teichoic acid biosynthesis glycosyltransferase